MTEQELQAIKARHAAATADKWELLYDKVSDEHEFYCGASLVGVGYYVEEIDDFLPIVMAPIEDGRGDDNDEANLTFIADAHADVPALVAEVERLRGELKKTRADLQKAYAAVYW